MTNALAILLAIVIVIAGVQTYRVDAAKLAGAAAQKDAAVCNSAAKSQTDAVAALQAKLKDLQSRHDAVLDAGTKALAARDARITALRRTAAAAQTKISELTHEDDSCTALASVPVCAAIAGQLWPAAQPTRGDAHPNR